MYSIEMVFPPSNKERNYFSTNLVVSPLGALFKICNLVQSVDRKMAGLYEDFRRIECFVNISMVV